MVRPFASLTSRRAGSANGLAGAGAGGVLRQASAALWPVAGAGLFAPPAALRLLCPADFLDGPAFATAPVVKRFMAGVASAHRVSRATREIFWFCLLIILNIS